MKVKVYFTRDRQTARAPSDACGTTDQSENLRRADMMPRQLSHHLPIVQTLKYSSSKVVYNILTDEMFTSKYLMSFLETKHRVAAAKSIQFVKDYTFEEGLKRR